MKSHFRIDPLGEKEKVWAMVIIFDMNFKLYAKFLFHYVCGFVENNNSKKKAKKTIEKVNRSEAKERLKNGEYILENGSGHAEFWKSYKRLVTKDGKDTNCVQCQQCLRFDEYDTEKGLKHLNNHFKNCGAFGGERKISTFVKREVKITRSEKIEITNAAMKYCYKDMRPFSAVEGVGLNNLLEAVSALSAKYGKLTAEQIKEILPVANTVIHIYLHFSSFLCIQNNFFSCYQALIGQSTRLICFGMKQND